VEAPASRGAEHQGVWLAREVVPVEMPVEHLGDQARQRDGAPAGGGLGFGAVSAHLGHGFDHLQSVVREIDSADA
jgi:hypothetical protein